MNGLTKLFGGLIVGGAAALVVGVMGAHAQDGYTEVHTVYMPIVTSATEPRDAATMPTMNPDQIADLLSCLSVARNDGSNDMCFETGFEDGTIEHDRLYAMVDGLYRNNGGIDVGFMFPGWALKTEFYHDADPSEYYDYYYADMSSADVELMYTELERGVFGNDCNPSLPNYPRIQDSMKIVLYLNSDHCDTPLDNSDR